MKRWTNDRIGAGLLLLFFMAYGLLSQEIRLLPGQSGNVFNARTLPHFLTAVGVIGALWLFFRSQLPSSGGLRTLNWGRFAGTLILMWCYGLALRPAGFLIATAAFLGPSFLLLGERRWRVMALVTVITTLCFWLLAYRGLNVFLPPWPQPAYASMPHG